jgi:hypothetical protein
MFKSKHLLEYHECDTRNLRSKSHYTGTVKRPHSNVSQVQIDKRQEGLRSVPCKARQGIVQVLRNAGGSHVTTWTQSSQSKTALRNRGKCSSSCARILVRGGFHLTFESTHMFEKPNQELRKFVRADAVNILGIAPTFLMCLRGTIYRQLSHREGIKAVDM